MFTEQKKPRDDALKDLTRGDDDVEGTEASAKGKEKRPYRASKERERDTETLKKSQNRDALRVLENVGYTDGRAIASPRCASSQNKRVFAASTGPQCAKFALERCAGVACDPPAAPFNVCRASFPVLFSSFQPRSLACQAHRGAQDAAKHGRHPRCGLAVAEITFPATPSLIRINNSALHSSVVWAPRQECDCKDVCRRLVPGRAVSPGDLR
ncbi:hypothetical protein MRX96_054542 [Rhipicephalus microplus]